MKEKNDVKIKEKTLNAMVKLIGSLPSYLAESFTQTKCMEGWKRTGINKYDREKLLNQCPGFQKATAEECQNVLGNVDKLVAIVDNQGMLNESDLSDFKVGDFLFFRSKFTSRSLIDMNIIIE